MKAEKVLGIVACAFACASSSVFANTTTNWFDVGVSAGVISFSSNVTTNGTNVAGVTVEDGKIKIDNEKDTALSLVASSEPETSDGIVIITATAELTPNLTNDLFTTDVGSAKAGFAVGYDDEGNTNYYGYANGRWTNLGGTPTSAETTFKIELDYRTGKKTVKFFVDDTQLSPGTSFSLGDASELASVDAFGTGSISLVNAKCEVAEVSYDGIQYGSVAEALADATAAGHDASDIKAPNGTDTQSASGLPVAVCVAAGLDITDPTAAVTAVPVDNDTNASNVTLQMDTTGLTPEPGVVINFAVKQGETPVVGSPFPANAILVPCATGIYTVEPVSVTAAPAP